MLPKLIIALLLASPVAARDQAVGPPASAGDSDVCSYIKDMKGMADGSAAKLQVSALEQRLQLACEKTTWAVLADREPAVNSAWREAVPKRRALIEKSVAILRKHAVAPKALEDTPENPAAAAANADLSRLPGYSAGKPLNAQSIAAWLPPEADGAKQVYAMWLVVQNSRLRSEKWGQEQQKDPMSPERFKQIDDTLAANKARLKRMERIEDPGEFKSFVEGSEMGQGDSRNGVDAAALLKPGGPSGESADNRPLKVQQSMRGVERKSVPMPSQPESPPQTPTEQSEGSGLIGKALGFGSAAVAGALVLWRKRRDEQELDAAREEVAAEDRAHAMAKGEIIVPPTLTSDPAGFAADRALRAKEFVQDHPYVSLGVGLGSLALVGYLTLPAMITGGGGGGLALATAGEAALVTAPAATVTLPEVGVAVVGGAVVLMASDSKNAGNSSQKQIGGSNAGDDNDARHITRNFKEAVRRLKVDEHKASDALHKAKKSAGRKGADNVEFDTKNGDIRSPETGEVIGNLFD